MFNRTAFHLVMAVVVLAALSCRSLDAHEHWGMQEGSVDLASATTLAFGPDDILFIGDAKAATVFAVATADQNREFDRAPIAIQDLSGRLATQTASQDVTVHDLVVNPRTGTAFLAVSADTQPMIVMVTGGNQLEVLNLKKCFFSKAVLDDAPEDKVVKTGRRTRNPRQDAITDLAFFENKLLVSGLRDAVASSSVRELSFPFADQERGIGVQIYHAAHGREEETSAMRTFVPLMIDGEPTIVGAYICTPLVKIPVSELGGDADRVNATTVAELGNRNRPLDMVAYERDGQEYLLLSNSARGVMKIPTHGLAEAPGLVEPVRGGGTAGQPYETIDSLDGLLEMDLHSDAALLVLMQDQNGKQNLMTVGLP